MTKARLFILATTFLIVGTVGVVVTLFARGYRLSLQDDTISLSPSGLLVANSDPTGAQVFINGELKTATDNTISIPPGTYDISIKKEGFLEWKKRLTIEKETVSQIDAYLVSTAPSLTAFTISGALNPQFSPDFGKIAYVVPANGDSQKAGLWIIETVNLPLGFNREARRITDGDVAQGSWKWSPDGREILLTTSRGVFLLNTSEFTPQAQLVNIASQKEIIEAEWEEEEMKRLSSQLSKIDSEIRKVFERYSTDIAFSPDGNRLVYTATAEANIPQDIVKQLPGASTQQQERNIEPERTYIYDIKEDRNFVVAEAGERVLWLPNSLNIIIPREDGILIKDYDGTNEQKVYAGSYVYPHAFPSTNAGRILILTNLGNNEATPNLYWLSLK